jgi:hypothetical protein
MHGDAPGRSTLGFTGAVSGKEDPAILKRPGKGTAPEP